MKFKVTLGDQLAMKMAAAAGAITTAHMLAAKKAMRDLTIAAHEKAIEMAGQRLNTTKQKYMDNLDYDVSGDNSWTVTLHGDAAYLEEGYGSYDMIKAGLARGPKSKVSKAGYRYVVIPMDHSEKYASPRNPRHLDPVQIGQAGESTKGTLAADLRRLKQVFGHRDDSGKNVPLTNSSGDPVMGKAYTIKQTPFGPWEYTNANGIKKIEAIGGAPINKNLSGLTAIQWKDKANRTQTAYLTWRVASENPASQGKWQHPGFDGARIFPDLEQWAVNTIGVKLREIFQE